MDKIPERLTICRHARSPVLIMSTDESAAEIIYKAIVIVDPGLLYLSRNITNKYYKENGI